MNGKSDNYIARLLGDASRDYPFIRQYDPKVAVGAGPYYAETWPVGEEGGEDFKRPEQFPRDRTGVMVYRPHDFRPSDLAAEMLHIDPFANATRNILQQILAPRQVEQLKRESGDYQDSVKEGLHPEKAMANAVDSAMRGYAVGQWPAEANAAMHYTPEQGNFLEALKSYMESGIYPLNYKLPSGNRK